MDNLKVAILGSTGYTGIELLKILDNHPKVTIKFLGANKNTKLKAQSLFSGLKNSINLIIRNNYDIRNYKDIDVVFSCMPQGELSKNFSKFKFQKNQCLLDLSADFRLPENLNQKWYGIKKTKFSIFQEKLFLLNKNISLNLNIIKWFVFIQCLTAFLSTIIVSKSVN